MTERLDMIKWWKQYWIWNLYAVENQGMEDHGNGQNGYVSAEKD